MLNTTEISGLPTQAQVNSTQESISFLLSTLAKIQQETIQAKTEIQHSKTDPTKFCKILNQLITSYVDIIQQLSPHAYFSALHFDRPLLNRCYQPASDEQTQAIISRYLKNRVFPQIKAKLQEPLTEVEEKELLKASLEISKTRLQPRIHNKDKEPDIPTKIKDILDQTGLLSEIRSSPELNYNNVKTLAGFFSMAPLVAECLRTWIEISDLLSLFTDNIPSGNQDLLKESEKLAQALCIRQGEPMGEYLSWLQYDNIWSVYEAIKAATDIQFDNAVMTEIGDRMQKEERSFYTGEYDRFLGTYLLTKFSDHSTFPAILTEAIRPWNDSRPSPLIDDHRKRQGTYIAWYLSRNQRGLAADYSRDLIKEISTRDALYEQFCRIQNDGRVLWSSDLRDIVNSHLLKLIKSGKRNDIRYATAALLDIKGGLNSETEDQLLKILKETKDQNLIEEITDLFLAKVKFNGTTCFSAITIALQKCNDQEAKERWIGQIAPRYPEQLEEISSTISAAFNIPTDRISFFLKNLSHLTDSEKETLLDQNNYLMRGDGSWVRNSPDLRKANQIVRSYLAYACNSELFETIELLSPYGFQPKAEDFEVVSTIAVQLPQFKISLSNNKNLGLLTNLAELGSLRGRIKQLDIEPLVLAMAVKVSHQDDFPDLLVQIHKDIVQSPQDKELLVTCLWKALDILNSDSEPVEIDITQKVKLWGEYINEIISSDQYKTSDKNDIPQLDRENIAASRKNPESLRYLMMNLDLGSYARLEAIAPSGTLYGAKLSERNRLLFIEPVVLDRFLSQAGAQALLSIIAPIAFTSSPNLLEDLSKRAVRLGQISRDELLIKLVHSIDNHDGLELLSQCLAGIHRLASSDIAPLLNYCNALAIAINQLSVESRHTALNEISEAIVSGKIQDLIELREMSKKPVISILSQVVPQKIVERISTERLMDLAAVYLPYQKQIRKSDLMPWLQAAATAEALNLSREWKTGDPKVSNQIFRAISSMCDSQSQLLTLTEKRKLARQSSPISSLQVTTQKEWRTGSAMYAHVVRDVAIEDRLRSLINTISQLQHPTHLTPLSRKVLEIDRNEGLLQALSTSIQSLLKTNKEDPRLDDLMKTQKAYSKWQPIWWMVNRATDVLQLHLDEMSDLRKELGKAEQLITAMGFDFRDSFATHTYLGELRVLRSKLDEPQWNTASNREQLAIIRDACTKWNEVERRAMASLGNIAKTAKKAVALLEEKKGALDQLTEDLAKKSSLSLDSYQINTLGNDLFLPNGDTLSRLLDTPSALHQITDIEVIRDLEAISAGCNSSEQSQILIYRPEYEFSRALKAFVGQCLDYRSGINAKYNLAWCEDHFEAVVALDQDEVPRVNFLIWVATLESEDDLYTFRASEKVSKQPSETTLVIDPVYTPDGSPVTWDKIEGALNFALQRATSCKLDLVVPIKVISSYEADFAQWCENQNCKHQKLDLPLTITPGANEGVYLEMQDWDSYEQKTTKRVTCWKFSRVKDSSNANTKKKILKTIKG